MQKRLNFAAKFSVEDNTLTGLASVYNTPTVKTDARNFRIMPGAFAQVMQQDVVALFNHNPDLVLGRVSAGTLRLSDESNGLRFAVDLPDTQTGRDVRTLVARGDVNGASFSCLISDFELEGGTTLVTGISDLFDVGPVTYPAFDATSVELHSVKPKDDVEVTKSGLALARARLFLETQKRK